MYTFVLVTHIVLAVILVIVVLLQSGKGGGLGAGFGGGGANTLFGSSGGSNFFTKLTMGVAAVFMCTSLGLTVMASHSLRSSIFDQSAPATAPAPVNNSEVAPSTGAPSAAPATGTEPAQKAIAPAAAIPKK